MCFSNNSVCEKTTIVRYRSQTPHRSHHTTTPPHHHHRHHNHHHSSHHSHREGEVVSYGADPPCWEGRVLKRAPPKTCESADPSQVRQGSLELALDTKNEQTAADIARVMVPMTIPLQRCGRFRREWASRCRLVVGHGSHGHLAAEGSPWPLQM